MKTAMIQFLEWLENSSNVKDDILNWELVKENALDKEKEQIVKAHNEGIWIEGKAFDDGEEYYNNNYGE